MLSGTAALGKSFNVLASGLDGLSLRQQVRGENLANIDTPGYSARTVDFEGALRSAMSDNSSATSRGFLGGGPMSADGAMLPMGLADGMTGAGAAMARSGGGGIDASQFTIRTVPGGAVDRVAEASGMAQDLIRFRVLTQQVTNKIQGLRNVISEMGRA